MIFILSPSHPSSLRHLRGLLRLSSWGLLREYWTLYNLLTGQAEVWRIRWLPYSIHFRNILMVGRTLLGCFLIDFSSAFNCIQLHILANRLINMDIDHDLTCWLTDFLTDRSQKVGVNGVLSNVLLSSTGRKKVSCLQFPPH